jgi:hypothetical protein
MAKRTKTETRVFSTLVVPDRQPTGNAFRLRSRPSWFTSNSPVYTKSNPVCSVIGKGGGERCPVQQFFTNGEVKLRFCENIGEKAPTIDMGADFEKANATAQRLCKCWKASSADPRKRTFKDCADLPSSESLGGFRRPKKRRR